MGTYVHAYSPAARESVHLGKWAVGDATPLLTAALERWGYGGHPVLLVIDAGPAWRELEGAIIDGSVYQLEADPREWLELPLGIEAHDVAADPVVLALAGKRGAW